MSISPKVWLITGASRGLGLELTKTALAAGHTVIACRRSDAGKDASALEVEKLGAKWVQVDLGSDSLETQLADAIQLHGKVDVLVNNAGYGLSGTIEDTSIEEINRIFRVNTLGPIRTAKVMIPSMRAQGSGTIVNIGSSMGISAIPGIGIYSATKYALEATCEALQVELAPFNIRVLLVEPGAMATRMTDPAAGSAVVVPLSDCYKGSYVECVCHHMADVEGFIAKAGSANKVALRIVEAVDGTGMLQGKEVGLRLPLGKDTAESLRTKGKQLTGLAENLKEIYESI